MQVSKEFIEAMNGILNDEKWKRKIWSNFYIAMMKTSNAGIMIVEFLKFVEENGYYFDECYHTKKHDMTATDWVKVED